MKAYSLNTTICSLYKDFLLYKDDDIEDTFDASVLIFVPIIVHVLNALINIILIVKPLHLLFI